MSFTSLIEQILLAAAFSASVVVAAAPDLGAARARPGVESIQIAMRFGWTIRLPDGRLMSIWTEGKKLAEATADTESVDFVCRCWTYPGCPDTLTAMHDPRIAED